MAGAPKGNKNAKNNNGGAPKGNSNASKEKEKRTTGAPKGNLNALKHGMYIDERKRLPEEFLRKIVPVGLRNIYKQSKEMNLDPIEYLRHSIDLTWTKIMNSTTITYVKNKKDITKELKKNKIMYDKEGNETYKEEEYEIQLAWDKENDSLDVYTKSMERLAKMIEIHEKLTGEKYLLEIEEKRINVEKINIELNSLKGNNDPKSNSTAKLDSILSQIKDRQKDE